MNITDIFHGGELIPEVEKARSKMREFDKIDGGMERHSIDEQLRTALQAIRYGINSRDWDGVCERFVMVQDAELAFRKLMAREASRRN